MNQAVYEQLGLGLGKDLFMFVCLANEPSSSPSLSSISKRVKFKHNNEFVNKLVNKIHIIYNIYMYAYIKGVLWSHWGLVRWVSFVVSCVSFKVGCMSFGVILPKNFPI